MGLVRLKNEVARKIIEKNSVLCVILSRMKIDSVRTNSTRTCLLYMVITLKSSYSSEDLSSKPSFLNHKSEIN